MRKGLLRALPRAATGLSRWRNGGTLFLDETGELPASLQAQLLRVIQEGVYKPVGSNTWRETRFRLVCATNRDLLQDVTAGKFRSDLYFRIAVCNCELPPLCNRRDDILPLARHFLRQAHPEDDLDFDAAVQEYLIRREFQETCAT